MPSFLGAKDIGLKTDWRYGFAGLAQHATTTHGVLYIGAGRAVMPGVIDSERVGGEGDCCAATVFSRRELVYNHLLSDWIRRFEEGKISANTKWMPVLITQPDPGFDAVAASFLALRLIEKGEFPVYAEALVRYADDVARGRIAINPADVESMLVPHMACQAVQYAKGSDGRVPGPETRFARALEALDRILSHILMGRSEAKAGPIRRTADFLPGSPGSAAWARDPWFAGIKTLLEAEPAKFSRDAEHARKIEGALLPADDGGEPVPVNAFVAAHPMESVLHRHWVAASGFPYLIYPSGTARTSPDAPPDPDPVFPRATILLDPSYRKDGRRPCLRGLGSALDIMERKYRRAPGEGAGEKRTASGAMASGTNCEESWDDGADSGWTVVESPRPGTAIPYSGIVDLATKRPFYEIPLRRASLAMIWVERTQQAEKKGEQLPASLCSLSGLPDSYGQGLAESSPEALPGATALPEGITADRRTRIFPPGTCAPMTIAEIKAGPGATLEGLIEARSRVIAALGGNPPGYVFARVGPDDSACGSPRIRPLLHRLGQGPLCPLDGASSSAPACYSNSRSIIIRDDGTVSPEGGPDSERELLLYSAFLSESLAEYARRSDDVENEANKASGPKTIAALRGDLLRFRDSYWRSEAGRSARERTLFERLIASLRLEERYAKVRSGLALLTNSLAERSRGRTERLIQRLLFAVILMQVLQILVAVFW